MEVTSDDHRLGDARFGSDFAGAIMAATQADTASLLLGLSAIASPTVVLIGVIWSNLNARRQLQQAAVTAQKQIEAAAQNAQMQINAAAELARRQMDSSALVSSRQMEAAAENTRRQIKASVISSGRLRWIDTVREDIAEYMSLERTHREVCAQIAKSEDDHTVNLLQIKRNDVLQHMEMLLFRIELRMTRGREGHERLRLLLQEFMKAAPLAERDYELIEQIKDTATDLFSYEWNRLNRELEGDLPPTAPAVPLN